MAKHKTDLEDNFWSILDSHPDFSSLSLSKKHWAYEEIVGSMVNTDVKRPVSSEESSANLDSIFAELRKLVAALQKACSVSSECDHRESAIMPQLLQ